jgi:hypothetical protein
MAMVIDRGYLRTNFEGLQRANMSTSAVTSSSSRPGSAAGSPLAPTQHAAAGTRTTAATPIAVVCFDDSAHKYPLLAPNLRAVQDGARDLLQALQRLPAGDKRPLTLIPFPNGSFSEAIEDDAQLRALLASPQTGHRC